ncbi:MAG: hypothetical protein ACODAD_15520, partial [Planctomycetota bacterium]
LPPPASQPRPDPRELGSWVNQMASYPPYGTFHAPLVACPPPTKRLILMKFRKHWLSSAVELVMLEVGKWGKVYWNGAAGEG